MPNCVHYNLPAEQQHAVEQYVGLTGYPTYRLFDKQGRMHHLNWLDDENLSEFKKKLDAMGGIGNVTSPPPPMPKSWSR
ncbi:MAG: hypothetical protein IJ243_03625 [Prevotella sp.]|nr:hypothetical protein [Prevotella sp.]